MRRATIVVALIALSTTGRAEPQTAALAGTLEQVGARVMAWYARARSIVSDERVWIHSLRADMASTDGARLLTFELRVDWDPESGSSGARIEPTVHRRLVSVNGRPPSADADAGCMDPKDVTTEPLVMLLPEQRADFEFRAAGAGRDEGREALLVDFRSLTRRTPEITWTGDCVSVTLPGWTAGRIWVDPVTYDVLRLDERLTGQFDFEVPVERQRRGAPRSMLIERADTSIRYRRVEFSDPTETLMLPDSVETLTIVRGAGVQRNRISQRYSGHRRFLGAGRVVVP